MCSSVDEQLSVQQEYLLLLHYADQLEAVGHPDFSASMNQTVELLMEMLPQLDGTVSLQYTCMGPCSLNVWCMCTYQ